MTKIRRIPTRLSSLSGSHYYSHFNPAIGMTYKLMPSLTVYGSYSEANAAPTPAELSCASPERLLRPGEFHVRRS